MRYFHRSRNDDAFIRYAAPLAFGNGAFREKAGPLNAQPPTILVLEASVAGDPAKGILG